MSVNSIRAPKLSAIVPRILLNKKEAFISGRFLGLCSSSLFIFDEHFFVTFFSVRYLLRQKVLKLLKCSLKTTWHQVKVQFN